MEVSKSCCAEVRVTVNWSVNFILLYYMKIDPMGEKMDSLSTVHGRLDFSESGRLVFV